MQGAAAGMPVGHPRRRTDERRVLHDDWPDHPGDWRPVSRPSTPHGRLATAVLMLAVQDAEWTRGRGAAAAWLLHDPAAAWWASLAEIDIAALRAAVRARMGA